jgi:hypothetical protein
MLIPHVLNHSFPPDLQQARFLKNQRDDFPAGWEKGIVRRELLLKKQEEVPGQ